MQLGTRGGAIYVCDSLPPSRLHALHVCRPALSPPYAILGTLGTGGRVGGIVGGLLYVICVLYCSAFRVTCGGGEVVSVLTRGWVLWRRSSPYAAAKQQVSWMYRNSGLIAFSSVRRYCSVCTGGPSMKYSCARVSSYEGQSRM